MSKPIPDKAEVTLEYPDKFYIGTFERTARFEAHLDPAGISLSLDRGGEVAVRKSVHMHFHYALFADILQDLAQTVAALPPQDEAHRQALRDGAKALYLALGGDAEQAASQSATQAAGARGSADLEGISPEEEVLLLHVIE
ncbi:MAG TPA: hypothetical protein VH934_19370 [Xanthobacteraceae bacterium]|jgi:hypothetical protein